MKHSISGERPPKYYQSVRSEDPQDMASFNQLRQHTGIPDHLLEGAIGFRLVEVTLDKFKELWAVTRAHRVQP